MAIQNFISGGYVGKLGDTVGQRWHNKRTVRSYVVPANPRTASQQANRSLFARAVQLAQIAYNVNKGSPAWDTTQMGQFSQLVSLAKRRLQAGMSDADALPLYPDGYQPSTVLGDVSVSWSGWPPLVSITARSSTLPQSRSWDIIMHWWDVLANDWVDTSFPYTNTVGGYLSPSISNASQFAIPAGSTVSAATTDDLAHGGESIYLPSTPLVQSRKPIIPITLSFSLPVQGSYSWEWFIPVSGSVSESDVYLPVSVWCYSPDVGRWESKVHEMGDHPPVGWSIGLGVDPDEEVYPSGSRVIAGSASTSNDYANLSYSWPDYPFSTP